MFTVEENGAVKENGAVTITTTCEGEIEVLISLFSHSPPPFISINSHVILQSTKMLLKFVEMS